MIKKFVLLFAVLLCFLIVSAQITLRTTSRLRSGTSLPATCSATGQIFYLTSGTAGLYMCTAADTWTITGAIDISGTSINDQIAVWTDADTVEGDADLTWEGTFNRFSLNSTNLGNNTAGPSVRIGRNNNVTQSSGGYLRLTDLGNTSYFVHADDAGLLRIGTTTPTGTADTTNGVVGDQASFQFHLDGSLNKIEIGSITPAEGLSLIEGTVFRRGKYAEGAYNDGEFVWPYAEEAPYLMQDPSGELPGGRSHSPISHASLNSLAIQALSQKIEDLEKDLERIAALIAGSR